MGENNQNYSFWKNINNKKYIGEGPTNSPLFIVTKKIKHRASSNQVMILNLPPTTIQIESSVERISRYKKNRTWVRKKQRWNNKRRTHSIMQKRKASRKLSAHELIQHAMSNVCFVHCFVFVNIWIILICFYCDFFCFFVRQQIFRWPTKIYMKLSTVSIDSNTLYYFICLKQLNKI